MESSEMEDSLGDSISPPRSTEKTPSWVDSKHGIIRLSAARASKHKAPAQAPSPRSTAPATTASSTSSSGQSASSSTHLLRGLSASANTRCLLQLRLTDAALRALTRIGGSEEASSASVTFADSSASGNNGGGVVGFLNLPDGTRLSLTPGDSSEHNRPAELVRYSHQSQSASRLGRIGRRLTVDAAAPNSKPTPASAAAKSGTSASTPEPTLRDRMLHLLAVRPLTRPELLTRLRADGLTPPDPTALASLLVQLAKLQGDGRGYGLRACLYKEVRPDSWAVYSDSERALVKRRIAEASASLSAVSTSCVATPKLDKPSTIATTDRVVSGVHANHINNNNDSVGNKNSSSTGAKDGKVVNPKHSDDGSLAAELARLSSCDLCDIGMDVDADVDCEDFEDDDEDDQFKGEIDDIEVDGDETGGCAMDSDGPCSDVDDADRRRQRRLQKQKRRGQHQASSVFVVTLKPIRCAAQRSAYKSLYDRHYPEYRRLWERVRAVSDQAAALEAQLARCRPGSVAHSEAGAAIVSLYRRYRHDASFRGDTKRCGRLQARLKRLRQLIETFDDSGVGD